MGSINMSIAYLPDWALRSRLSVIQDKRSPFPVTNHVGAPCSVSGTNHLLYLAVVDRQFVCWQGNQHMIKSSRQVKMNVKLTLSSSFAWILN